MGTCCNATFNGCWPVSYKHLDVYTRQIQYIDFNLVTGIRVEQSERYDTDKIISRKKRKIIIRPLPKLVDLVPMKNELY